MKATKDNQMMPTQTIKLRYRGGLGQLPKEIETYILIRKKDPVTKVVKTVPEIVYPLKAHRKPLPKHALLEDDYRAYKSVFHNLQHQFRNQQSVSEREYEKSRVNAIARKILGQKRGMPPTLMPNVAEPHLSVYQSSVEHPPGYLYRHYMDEVEASKATSKQKPKGQIVPRVIFEGAFQNMVHVPHGPNDKSNWKREVEMYDADVIIGGPTNNEAYIYNEPDAVPVQFAKLDFSVPLCERCCKISNEHTDEFDPGNLLIKVPFVLPNGERVFPVPELMSSSKPFDQGPISYYRDSNVSVDSAELGNRYAGAIHGL